MTEKLIPLILALALGVPLAFPHWAQATLGEPADSVAKDRRALSAVQRATTKGEKYTVQEMKTAGTTIREYLNDSGIVFAVAWKGLAHPNLDTLLGSYAGEYQDAAKQAPRVPGRRSSQVSTDNVVVEKWGHMRALRGRAYAPSLLPEGVDIDEIK